MKTKHLILVLILLRMVFLAIPDTIIHPYLFTGDGIPASAYFWNQLETVFILFLIWRWAKASNGGAKEAVWALFLIVCYDFIDFACNGNTAYWWIGPYPVTNNAFMLLAYVVLTWNAEEL